MDEQAARWAARIAHGTITAQARHALEAWLAADRRHRGALVRAQAALHALEEAVMGDAPALARSGNDGDYGRRRRRVTAAWAVAASVVLVAMLAVLVPMPRDTVMNLADGSVVTLSGDAQIHAELDDRVRNIVLARGQARFDVAKDPARPFVVHAGDVSAQATGTVYAVDRVGDRGATVRVEEGSVLVWSKEARDQAVLLRAGDMLTLEPGSGVDTALPPPEVAEIALNDEPIAVAAARFNRINGLQIDIADPDLGRVRIVGLFKANDPQAFARAAAAVAGGCAVRREDRIVLQAAPCGVTKN